MTKLSKEQIYKNQKRVLIWGGTLLVLVLLGLFIYNQTLSSYDFLHRWYDYPDENQHLADAPKEILFEVKTPERGYTLVFFENGHSQYRGVLIKRGLLRTSIPGDLRSTLIPAQEVIEGSRYEPEYKSQRFGDYTCIFGVTQMQPSAVTVCGQEATLVPINDKLDAYYGFYETTWLEQEREEYRTQAAYQHIIQFIP